MKEYWDTLCKKLSIGIINKDEELIYKKIGKTMFLLSQNPRHPGLNTHEIAALTARYGMKVWESYIENNTPSAGRLFWVYGPNQKDITIIGIEPHPNDKKRNAYKKITLSKMGDELR